MRPDYPSTSYLDQKYLPSERRFLLDHSLCMSLLQLSSQIDLISPGCPRPNSALTVQKSGLKHRSSIRPYCNTHLDLTLFHHNFNGTVCNKSLQFR